jgi:hypothetical protein
MANEFAMYAAASARQVVEIVPLQTQSQRKIRKYKSDLIISRFPHKQQARVGRLAKQLGKSLAVGIR